MADLQATINDLWARRDELDLDDADAYRIVDDAIGLLDRERASPRSTLAVRSSSTSGSRRRSCCCSG